jgi:hypothetical protein
LGPTAGRSNCVTDVGQAGPGHERTVRYILGVQSAEFWVIAALEQAVVLKILHIMDAHSAVLAFGQFENPPNRVLPSVWVKRAVIDCPDGV